MPRAITSREMESRGCVFMSPRNKMHLIPLISGATLTAVAWTTVSGWNLIHAEIKKKVTRLVILIGAYQSKSEVFYNCKANCFFSSTEFWANPFFSKAHHFDNANVKEMTITGTDRWKLLDMYLKSTISSCKRDSISCEHWGDEPWITIMGKGSFGGYLREYSKQIIDLYENATMKSNILCS